MEKKTAALKKRLTSLLTAAVMAVSLVPAQALTSLSAFAEDQEDATKIGRLESGKPRHGNGWSWDGNETLTLFGAELSSGSSDVPVVEPTCDIKLDLINYNRIELSGDGAFINDGSCDVSIDGSGILDINSSSVLSGMTVKNLELNGGFIRTEPITITAINDITVNDGYVDGQEAHIRFAMDSGAPGQFTQTGGYVSVYEVFSAVPANMLIDGGYAEFMLMTCDHSTVEVKHGIFKCKNNSTYTIPGSVKINVASTAIAMFPDYTKTELINYLLFDPDITINDSSQNGVVLAASFYDENTSSSYINYVGSTPYSIYNEGKTLSLEGDTYGGSIYSYAEGYNSAIDLYSSAANIGEKATLYGDGGNQGVETLNMSFGDKTTVIGFGKNSYGVSAYNLVKAPATIIGVNTKNNCGVYANGLCDLNTVIGILDSQGSYGKYAVEFIDAAADRVTAVSTESGRGAYFANEYTKKLDELTAYSHDDLALCITEDHILPVKTFGVYSGSTDSPIKKVNGSWEAEISFSDLDDFTIYALSDDNAYITDAKLRNEIGRSVYMGKKLFDAVNADPKGSVGGSIYETPGLGEFSADVVFSNSVSADDISVSVSKDGADVTDEFSTSAEKRIVDGYNDEDRLYTIKISNKNTVTIGTQYDITVKYNDSSATFKTFVRDIDFSLNFDYSRGSGNVKWSYGGDFTGYEDNCSGSGWAWYGSAADGYEAGTLVLDGLDFHTSGSCAIQLPPGDVTIVVKGTNSISSQAAALVDTHEDTVVSIIGEDGSKLVAGSEICYRETGVFDVDRLSTLSVKGVDLDITAGNGYDDNSGRSLTSVGISAGTFIAEDADIKIQCGIPLNDGDRVGILVPKKCILKDNVNITVNDGDYLIKTRNSSSALKTLQAKTLSNIDGFADAAEFNASFPNDFYDAAYGSCCIRIADPSQPATFSTYSITQVRAAKTDDVLTESSGIDVDLNECFEGGSGKYVFTAPSDLPAWLRLNADGKVVLAGSIPQEDSSTSIFKFTVADADADLAGEPVEFDFIVGARGNVHEVKITSNYGGTVSPEAGSYYYVDGDFVTITAQPLSGYRTTAFLDGEEVELTNGSYTISNITENHTFDVKFRIATEFDITVNCGEHGRVTPGSGTYNSGDEIEFVVTPDSGYKLSSFRVNDTEVKVTNNSYKLTVTGNTVIDAAFAKNSSGGGGGGRPVGPADPDKVDDRIILPSINGRDFDWDQVVKYILSQPEKSTIEINLNGLTSVPKKVIQALQTMNDTGEFVVDSVRSCIVYGRNDFLANDMNLEMLYSSVSTEGLRGTPGIKLDIFGSSLVPYTLRVKFRREFAGQIANMYRKTTDGAQFVGASLIGDDGAVLLDNAYTKDSYIVMIDSLSDLPGDADNNGVFNALDAAAVLKNSAANRDASNPAMADFNHDGRVDALDAAAMLRKLVS